VPFGGRSWGGDGVRQERRSARARAASDAATKVEGQRLVRLHVYTSAARGLPPLSRTPAVGHRLATAHKVVGFATAASVA